MIVNCVAYQDGQRVADISLSEIRHYLDHFDCFVWVALYEPDPDELDTLASEFDLHELAVEDASHGHQRPKVEEYGRSLFVVLHMIESEGTDLRTGEVAIFAGDRFVVSVRRESDNGFAEVRVRAEEEPDLLRHGPGYVLYALMDAVVDRYFPIIDRLEDDIEETEERIFAGSTSGQEIQALYNLKRKLMTLKHATQPLVEGIGKLHGARVPGLCAGLQNYFRDVYDHVQRLDHTIDNFRDTVTTAMSVNLALVAIHENDVTKRLAAYAALAVVPTLIAGVYGMNFDVMPELRWRFGYPLTIAAMGLLDLYLFRRFRKAGWL